jgi:hypothetical protein
MTLLISTRSGLFGGYEKLESETKKLTPDDERNCCRGALPGVT